MIKKLLLISMLLLLTSCNQPLGGHDFFNKINALEQSIEDDDWQKSKNQWNEFRSHYQDNTWKLMLLGDEGEYEGVHESLLRLGAAIDQQEAKDALIELANIKAYIQQIYSL